MERFACGWFGEESHREMAVERGPKGQEQDFRVGSGRAGYRITTGAGV